MMHIQYLENILILGMKEAGGIEALTADLFTLSKQDESIEDEFDEQEGIDVRLRYYKGFSLKIGDSSYDQDHRGLWGCSIVNNTDTADDCRNTAIDLFKQVKDALFEWAYHNSDPHRVNEFFDTE